MVVLDIFKKEYIMVIRLDVRTRLLMFLVVVMFALSAVFIYRDGFFSEQNKKNFPVYRSFSLNKQLLVWMPSKRKPAQESSLLKVERSFVVKEGDTCVSLTGKGGNPLSAYECKLALAIFGRSSTTLHIGEVVVLLSEDSLNSDGYPHYKRWRFMTPEEFRKK